MFCPEYVQIIPFFFFNDLYFCGECFGFSLRLIQGNHFLVKVMDVLCEFESNVFYRFSPFKHVK